MSYSAFEQYITLLNEYLRFSQHKRGYIVFTLLNKYDLVDDFYVICLYPESVILIYRPLCLRLLWLKSMGITVTERLNV